MALSSDLTPFYYKYLPGANTKGESFELGDKFVVTAQNCRFDPEPGGVAKREPIYYFNSVTTASYAVTGLYRYYKTDGTAKFVKTCGTNVYVGSDINGSFTSIRSSMTLGKRMSYLTYKDLLIGGNGYDNEFVYDGGAENVTWELGSCKAWTGSSLITMTRSSISYQVTIDTDAYVCGAISNTITITGCSIVLSNIPLGPIGTVNRKIYRRDSSTGTDYKYVGTIADNTTTTFTDSSPTTSGTVVPSVTDDMPKGAELQIHQERLFIARDPSNPNKIYYSNPYLPHYIQQTTNLDYMDISPNDNDEITGIPNYLGTMVCVKKNTVRKLNISGPQQQWYAEDPWTYHSGSPAPWSVCTTAYGIAWLGWDHWYMFDGANVNIIIDEFDTTDILSADYNDTVCYFWENELLAAYTLTPRAQSYHDRVMRYNFKRKALSIDTINANCFAAKRGDNETGELYYGDSTTGYVYQGVKEDIFYKISSKSDCNEGTLTNTFVGGTDSNAFIEIGNSVTPSSIPLNTCIFWNSDTPPDSGWTQVTDYDGRYLKIGTANTTGNFGVTVSETGQVTSSSIEINYVNWALYYKNNTTTINDLPTGAIVLYDQSSAPVGYSSMNPGYYVRISSTSVNSVGTDQIWSQTANGIVSTLDNYLSGNFVQRTGELDSWDGVARYCYCLTYNATVSSNGWYDATATYNSLFLQSALDNLTTNKGGDTEYGVNVLKLNKTVHDYETNASPAGDGSNTIDGDFTTYQMGTDHGNGNGGVVTTLLSSHLFSKTSSSETFNITKLRYSISASGWHSFNGGETCTYRIEYTNNTGASWTTVTGTEVTQSGSSSSGGSSTYLGSGDTTVSCNITCNGIRAYAYAAASDSNGTFDTDVRIYEFMAFGKAYKFASFPITRKIFGKLNNYNGSWETNSVTAGTWTSSPAQINAQTMVKLWWNEALVGTDTVKVYFRTGNTLGSCTSSSWSAAFTNPNGVDISSITANTYAQFKVDFMATDTTISNPRIYAADGYVIQYSYSRGLASAETSVEFIYEIGFRHFDQPMLDKIFKKIMTYHTGDITDQGIYIVYWETENSSGSFNVSLLTFSDHWSSYFPSDAMGKKINIKIYKNDLYAFKLHEIQGVYSPQPLII